MVSMNRLSTADRVRVVAALVEGCSIRATVRMTGVAKNTVVKLLADLGKACKRYHDEHVRGLSSERIQVDEVWSFVYAKKKNVPAAKQNEFGYGDVWTWTAIDADTKLVVSYLVGGRSADYAEEFAWDLSERLNNRVQLTSDAYSGYMKAINEAFGTNIDYAQLIKIFGPDGKTTSTGRYSPPPCIGVKVNAITGNPEPKHINTSYVERQNLTMRMGMRRFTRLTNAFSKKIDNHAYAVALHFMHYNYCRVHQTLRVTPAMAAGLADHVWEIDELVALL